MNQTIIVIGGGIAGVSCLESLIQEFDYNISSYNTIILISESRIIKKVKNHFVRGRHLETFDVAQTELNIEDFNIPKGLHITFVVGTVKHVDTNSRTVLVGSVGCNSLESTYEYPYDYLSICVGASPRKLNVPGLNESFTRDKLVTIRDTTSVEYLRSKLTSCTEVAIVGAGGIGLELVGNICGCNIIWIVRDDHMGYPLLDSGASKFFMDSIDCHRDDQSRRQSSTWSVQTRVKRSGKCQGPALGPNWLQHGNLEGSADFKSSPNIINNAQVESIERSINCDTSILIKLTDGRSIDCDLIIVAIGVNPNSIEFKNGNIEVSDIDGGIIVDEQMRTSLERIYAAGDVVSCERWLSNPLWFQMRSWIQARQMGFYCGRCIASHLKRIDPSIYATFDCFTHITQFFGKKVVLLGRYNDLDLDHSSTDGVEVIVRVRPGNEYVRLNLKSGVIIGAILVGDTELEETIENLIHDAINVADIKYQLLDNTVDIQDYFD